MIDIAPSDLPVEARSTAVVAASRRSPPTTLWVFLGAGAVAFSIGILTAYAQGLLPDSVRSLANSSGPWAVVAFALALLAARPHAAAATGAIALLALLAGYVVGAGVRGAPSSNSLIIFWSTAALTVGPVLGLAASSVRAGQRWQTAVGIGALAGVLVGEGIYGLTVVADTTPAPYWIAEIAVGIIGLVAVGHRKPTASSFRILAIGTMIATASAFLAIYRLDLIALV